MIQAEVSPKNKRIYESLIPNHQILDSSYITKLINLIIIQTLISHNNFLIFLHQHSPVYSFISINYEISKNRNPCFKLIDFIYHHMFFPKLFWIFLIFMEFLLIRDSLFTSNTFISLSESYFQLFFVEFYFPILSIDQNIK